jgi:hypothetical protein
MRAALIGACCAALHLLGASAAVSAAPARRPPGSLHVRLKLPQPGDFSVARIVVFAKPHARLALRQRLRAANRDRIAPTIAAAGAVVRVRRTRSGVRKFVALVVIVNRREPKPKGIEPAATDPTLDLDFQTPGLATRRHNRR